MADYRSQLDELVAQLYNQFRPPPELKLSEWADEYARLSPESSAEPGIWKCLPYQVGILDAFTDPEVEKITWMKSARVGYTKCLNHAIGYHVHLDPCNILIVQPTLEDADGYSKDELATMIRDTPVLEGLIADPRSRDGSNTIRKKSFPGGVLYLVGANSPRGFRRISARVVLFDEVDGYPPSAGTEGDQIALGTRRSEYFYNRKIALGSTPGIRGPVEQGGSRIEASFEESDKRYYHVPCPACKSMQVLKWSNLQWPKDNPERAHYVCEICESKIDHSEKQWMVERGDWFAEQPFNGHAGFHIWAAYSYSPNAAWSILAREFLESRRDSERLQAFTNTVLGETWEEEAERVDWEILYDRREKYDSPAAGALVLTMGVDVQENRLECDVQGWAPDRECWQVEYFILYGDTDRPDVWKDLADALLRTYRNDYDQELAIACTCVDSGYRTDFVYSFCKKHAARRVYPTKGQAGAGLPVAARAQKKKTAGSNLAVNLFNLGIDGAKSVIYHSLRSIHEPGPGYFHFNDQLTPEYFEGLTAEKIVTKKRRGFEFREWHQIRPRNEQLDTAVMNLAAITILNPTWQVLLDNAHNEPAPEPTPPTSSSSGGPGLKHRGNLGLRRRP